MKTIHVRCALALIALLVAVSRPARAQADPELVKRRSNCRLAYQVIETGNPAPHLQWALRYIAYCDRATIVPAVVAGMRRLRSSEDVPSLQRLFSYALTTGASETFRELLGIAADRSASVPARVVALLKLGAIRAPGRSMPSYSEVVGGLDDSREPVGNCYRRVLQDAPAYDTGALPTDYREQIDRLRRQLQSDQTEQPDVRSAAACI